ncbi:MAG: aminopeptidase P family protein [Pseudomonadota bacterium]
MATREKLASIRRLMQREGLTAYLVPSTDPHQSEYVPACWQRRAYLSGFTGSAGDVLVLMNSAGLWTDGRYFLQAEKQLQGTGITLFKMGESGIPTLDQFLAQSLKKGQKLGVDPRVISLSVADALKKAVESNGGKLALLPDNLVDEIWPYRPDLPRGRIRVLPDRFSGEATASKLKRVREEMRKRSADAHVLTALDAVAWTFNVRGSDVDYNPVVVGYGLITPRTAHLFLSPEKVPPEAKKKLGPFVQTLPYAEIEIALRQLARAKARVWVDGITANRWVVDRLRGATLITDRSPVAYMKARKNPTEIRGMKKAHVRDGVAMVRFLYWLAENVPSGSVTELSAETILENFRRQGEKFVGPSFRTISAYGEHGAIIHYEADQESNVPLHHWGIYLIDSGGQYLDGTTDITRTILLGGAPTREQTEQFTRVLQGHIRLAEARFPSGVRGLRLDTLARAPLWEGGLDYNHGTGHGVGAFLSVHEGPMSVGPRCTGAPMEEGQILSNEPGYYKEGDYGIRIENTILAVRDKELSKGDKTWLRFETISFCPIERRLIDRRLLSEREKAWLNSYHARVERTLSPYLDSHERSWLHRACKKVS